MKTASQPRVVRGMKTCSPNGPPPWSKEKWRSRPATTRPDEPDDALDRATIADLSSCEISRMSRPELARIIIRVGELPCSVVHVELLDRGTLERLAYLARFRCRNQGLA